MAAVLRSPRLWLWVALVLPLLLVLTLAVVLVLSPAHRIRYLAPRLFAINGHVPEGVMGFLRDWMVEGSGTEAGFTAAIELLQHPDPQVRGLALVLAASPRPRYPASLDASHLLLLRTTIDDTDPFIARQGIQLLARLGDRQSLEAVLARYRRSTSPPITSAVLCYLGQLAPERFDSEAEQLGRAAEPGLWATALWAYGCFPRDRGLQALMAWIRSQDPQRSPLALSALARAVCSLSSDDTPAAASRVDRDALLALQRQAIADRSLDPVLRQRLLLCVIEQEAAYRLCQDLLRETHDHRRTAELAIHALHCLEPRWSLRPCLQYDATRGWMEEKETEWMTERWPAFSSPRPGDPPPADEEVLAAVRDAILAADRSTAARAITLALQRHLPRLEGEARAWVQRLIRTLAHPDPSFDF